jgi:hypothetical protein
MSTDKSLQVGREMSSRLSLISLKNIMTRRVGSQIMSDTNNFLDTFAA